MAAFLFQIGAYARLTALAFLADASVRRLSYAAMFVGTTVVLTVDLALCGIHLMRSESAPNRRMVMENRRTFLGLAAAAALLPIGLDAQTSAPRPAGDLARHPLTGPFAGFEAVLTEVTLPAGQPGASASNRAHRHTGFVLGYVIEGQLRFAINNEPERVVPAGGTFFEPIGALHSTNGATPGAPVRFLAFLVVPKGSPVVAPA